MSTEKAHRPDKAYYCMCTVYYRKTYTLWTVAFFHFPHSWVSWPLSTTVHCRSGCIYHCIRTWASRYHIRWWSEDNQAGSECNTTSTAPSCMLEEDMRCESLDRCLWHHRYGEGQPKDEVVWRTHEDRMGERCVSLQPSICMLLALLCCVCVCGGWVFVRPWVSGWVVFECMSLWECCVWIHGCWASMVFVRQCVVCTVDMSLLVIVSGCTHAVKYV